MCRKACKLFCLTNHDLPAGVPLRAHICQDLELWRSNERKGFIKCSLYAALFVSVMLGLISIAWMNELRGVRIAAVTAMVVSTSVYVWWVRSRLRLIAQKHQEMLEQSYAMIVDTVGSPVFDPDKGELHLGSGRCLIDYPGLTAHPPLSIFSYELIPPHELADEGPVYLVVGLDVSDLGESQRVFSVSKLSQALDLVAKDHDNMLGVVQAAMCNLGYKIHQFYVTMDPNARDVKKSIRLGRVWKS